MPLSQIQKVSIVRIVSHSLVCMPILLQLPLFDGVRIVNVRNVNISKGRLIALICPARILILVIRILGQNYEFNRGTTVFDRVQWQ